MNDMTGGLSFLPLGGTGEIGMNLNLYRLDGTWLAVDCGIGFSGNDTPEAEVLMPDPGFIAERSKSLCGLVITHAHEDHLGAVAHLWPQLRCPIYATPFAAAVLRRKLGEAHLLNQVKIHTVRGNEAFTVGPFDLQFVSVTHSVPEAKALILRTPQGIIVHTGDWKLDQEPVVGPVTDLEAFKAIGDEGVLAMVSDSTNALKDGVSGTEGSVRDSMAELIASLHGRIAITCFASNVARVDSIARAARKAGREVMIVGRSLRNLETAARECGYFADLPPFLTEQDANSVADDNLLMIITGSQGEPRSALSRIASDTHPNITLGEGDTVIYSSRMIPGNEQAVMAVQDNLTRRGVTVLTDKDHLVHVSGHATRDDMRTLYELVRPQYSVPVHGEWRHLTAHAALARDLGINAVLLEDGDVLNLGPGSVEVIDTAPTGRLALDGGRLLPMTGGVLAARRKMLFNGIVLASFAVDDEGYVIGEPKISAPGLLESEDPESIRITQEFADAIDEIPDELRQDDNAFRDAAKTALRRALGRKLQKRPLVDVHLLRV
ncbi:metal-dependent hydrolase [Neoasaia chiangmaiensis NBRC 101099]|uniref:MBL fold metallo-hydrolase n=1 Tax=Neoasaia chiangmaiensis TaxID=320497 RepID=A0A1U9KMQ8_9PROT|nr:ribonuclease J [Neoasaia chiangmaiensis]AQS87069.1 MBL fold metallo-hydrolase [Neoasaia chiangmaiensis]GBR37966.1 metal-dependent hydrolase [Neoasaia chiangmaiensis NBRC 101099]GEN15211.1 MBL fold hydrolase [Neoasaia chiangmaiensis]